MAAGCSAPPPETRSYELQGTGPGGAARNQRNSRQARRYQGLHAGHDHALPGQGSQPADRPCPGRPDYRLPAGRARTGVAVGHHQNRRRADSGGHQHHDSGGRRRVPAEARRRRGRHPPDRPGWSAAVAAPKPQNPINIFN